MIEVEIKAKVSNPDDLRKKFEDSNGIHKFSLLHEDTYFNMPIELRDFKKTDEALRIRKSIEFQEDINDLEKRIIKYYLTYKGKKLDSLTKSRNELEVIISDGIQLKLILKSLGFREIFTVKKERELYEFNYKEYLVEALIDYIPILKEYFIEVELQVDTDDELDNARDILFSFLSQFGIEREDSIRKSYLELIAEKFKEKNN
ncbi:MAG: class IV adenylate cyclase [Promethearchaeota archaeon]